MEYIELCTINNLIGRNIHGIRKETVKVIAKNMLRVLKKLHVKKICHRDIWTKNILCSEDGTKLKLIDFGVSRRFETDKESTHNNLMLT